VRDCTEKEKTQPVMAAFGNAKMLVGSEDFDLAVNLVVLDGAILECKERPIATDADVASGVDASAALADQDIAGDDGLTAKFFHAEPL